MCFSVLCDVDALAFGLFVRLTEDESGRRANQCDRMVEGGQRGRKLKKKKKEYYSGTVIVVKLVLLFGILSFCNQLWRPLLAERGAREMKRSQQD